MSPRSALESLPRNLELKIAARLKHWEPWVWMDLRRGGIAQEIGRLFGGMHHTTVLHCINRIEAMRRTDEALNDAIARLIEAVVAQF